MPHALITGGASGLGLATARRLAQLGYRITIADIDVRAAAAALPGLATAGAGRAARFEPVDLADPQSIDELAARLQRDGEPLDLLVNNAGIYPPSRRTLSPEGHELTFAIAHLGHFRLACRLWPLLQAAPSARVVTVSSLVQRQAALRLDDLSFARGYMPILAYRQAKLACLLFALELQRRLHAAGSRMRSDAAHPGVCRTHLARNRRSGEHWWHRFSSGVLRWGMGHIGQTPDQGADSVIIAATTRDYPAGSFIGPTGWLEAAGRPGVIRPGRAAADPALAAELWRVSEALTGIRWTQY